MLVMEEQELRRFGKKFDVLDRIREISEEQPCSPSAWGWA